ncbi:hypothetical protein [Labrys okinawensis]|uniref:hypothetical protein n=1 Tax=Labrys okinawensis TaxID=346911 RepID=UPI001FDF7296|nr:hypothetical protein [Labrys okinawensis]
MILLRIENARSTGKACRLRPGGDDLGRKSSHCCTLACFKDEAASAFPTFDRKFPLALENGGSFPARFRRQSKRIHGGSNMAFAIKAEIHDLDVEDFSFPAQKTMYGGKHVAAGDIIFLFASENEGGHGLFARGIVTCAQPIAKKQIVLRQTPRVSISVRRTALTQTPLEQSAFRRERVFALSLCLDASLRLLVTASNRKTL